MKESKLYFSSINHVEELLDEKQAATAISVVIPTLNAGKHLNRLLYRLLKQTVEAEIIIIDSGSIDSTVSIAERYIKENPGKVHLLRIPGESFDHGGTRDFALRKCSGDYVAFLTQDALPTSKDCLKNLWKAFTREDIAGVYGRQVAYSGAPSYEKYTRLFNYPVFGRVWKEEDISKYGVKAYFFSNTCAMYRRGIYEKVGGFDSPIITNEDMMMAAKLLHAGYALAYEPAACVFHSHNNTLLEDYRRNVRIGYVMQQYRERLTGASADSEGMRMVKYVINGLAREKHVGAMIPFMIHIVVKLAGNRVGKRRRKLDERST